MWSLATFIGGVNLRILVMTLLRWSGDEKQKRGTLDLLGAPLWYHGVMLWFRVGTTCMLDIFYSTKVGLAVGDVLAS